MTVSKLKFCNTRRSVAVLAQMPGQGVAEVVAKDVYQNLAKSIF